MMRLSRVILLALALGSCVEHDLETCYTGKILGYDCCTGTTLIAVNNKTVGKKLTYAGLDYPNVIQVPEKISGNVLYFTMTPHNTPGAGECFCLRSHNLPIFKLTSYSTEACPK